MSVLIPIITKTSSGNGYNISGFNNKRSIFNEGWLREVAGSFIDKINQLNNVMHKRIAISFRLIADAFSCLKSNDERKKAAIVLARSEMNKEDFNKFRPMSEQKKDDLLNKLPISIIDTGPKEGDQTEFDFTKEQECKDFIYALDYATNLNPDTGRIEIKKLVDRPKSIEPSPKFDKTNNKQKQERVARLLAYFREYSVAHNIKKSNLFQSGLNEATFKEQFQNWLCEACGFEVHTASGILKVFSENYTIENIDDGGVICKLKGAIFSDDPNGGVVVYFGEQQASGLSLGNVFFHPIDSTKLLVQYLQECLNNLVQSFSKKELPQKVPSIVVPLPAAQSQEIAFNEELPQEKLSEKIEELDQPNPPVAVSEQVVGKNSDVDIKSTSESEYTNQTEHANIYKDVNPDEYAYIDEPDFEPEDAEHSETGELNMLQVKSDQIKLSLKLSIEMLQKIDNYKSEFNVYESPEINNIYEKIQAGLLKISDLKILQAVLLCLEKIKTHCLSIHQIVERLGELNMLLSNPLDFVKIYELANKYSSCG